jgi:hypothetical protein
MHSALIKVSALDQKHEGYPVFVGPWGNAGDESHLSPARGLLPAASLLAADVPDREQARWIREQLGTRTLRTENAKTIGDILGRLLVSAVEEAKSLLACPGCVQDGGQPHSRVYFDVEESLSRLPWELTRIDSKFVFAQSGHVCLRVGSESIKKAYSLGRMRPLKVLIVVGQTDGGDRIRAEKEIEAVYRAVNARAALWRVKVMRVPTWSGLKKEVDDFPPDIVHLIGHSAPHGDDMAMVIQDEHGRYPLGADQLNRLFPSPGGAHGPRLFVLNTCDSMDLAAGMDLRVWPECTVVAMQSRIEGDAAAYFAKVFYERLVEGLDVDAAVQLARYELTRQFAIDDHAWALPVVIVSSRNHALLPGYSAMLADSRVPVNHGDFRWRNPLIDRVDEYRKLLDDNPLTGVTGVQGSGKSHLVCSYLMSCHQTGQLTVYVDLSADPSRRAPRDTVARMADEAVRQLAPELPATDFGELIRQGSELRQDAEDAALTVSERLEGVLHCLDVIAHEKEQDMVVALDGFELVADENQADFADQICAVVTDAARSGSRVRVIVVSGRRPLGGGGSGLRATRKQWHLDVPVIHVDGYRRQDLWSLYREACARLGRKWDEDLDVYLRKLGGRSGDPLLPEQFMAVVSTAFQDSAGG